MSARRLPRRAAGDPGAVQGGDRRRTALGLDAVQQDGAALGAEGVDGVDGVVEDEGEVRVLGRVGACRSSHTSTWFAGLDAARRHLIGAEAAEGDDRVDARGQLVEGADAAEPDVLVVGVLREGAAVVAGVVDRRALGQPARSG